MTPPLRILVAEDDESFLEAISLLLEQDDRFVVAGRARNGREAVVLAEEVAPDAVVVDIEMPILDGFEDPLLRHDRDLALRPAVSSSATSTRGSSSASRALRT